MLLRFVVSLNDSYCYRYLKVLDINFCRCSSNFQAAKNLDTEFNSTVAKQIEDEWKDRVTTVPEVSPEKPKYYVLSMFPYPSGKLHMGHVRVYTISDVMARYQRMKGYQVIHPMGWDAFGLPAENAARDHGLPPNVWTQRNIESMKKQLTALSCCFDWHRELSTCEPSYYKWTQYIFLKMHDAGLVYRTQAVVNWDPVDQTVLAEEQIDENGLSWRSGSHVEKRLLRQWYIRTTAYAQRLLDGLDDVDPVLWRHVVSLQKNWIGECDGCIFQFPLQGMVDAVKEPRIRPEKVDPKPTSRDKSFIGSMQNYIKHRYRITVAYLKSVYQGLKLSPPQRWINVLRLQDIATAHNFNTLITEMEASGARHDQDVLSVHTVHPEALFGVSLIALSPSHHYNSSRYHQDAQHAKEVASRDRYINCYIHCSSDFIPLKVSALHPFTQEHVPMFISSTVQFSKDTDVYLGIPSVNQSDRAISDRLGLRYNHVFTASDHVINSGQFNGLGRSDARQAIMKHAQQLGVGGHVSSAKLRDWLISRQRYWGTPIPIIHCPKCQIVPVPYSDLPVKLPELPSQSSQKPTTLSEMHDWIKVTCPKCGLPARRETDTMDTFVDSSWYFLRFLDAANQHAPFSKQLATTGMPVDLYIGGVEHAVLHLYFARFVTHFLHDIGLLHVREPFRNLLTQGMVMGQSYRLKNSGRYLPKSQVDFSGNQPVELSTGEAVTVQWEKMSKSKYNGVDPQEVIDKYGADSTRLCILAGVAPKSNRHWSSDVHSECLEDFTGVLNWQRRLWTLVMRLVQQKSSAAESSATPDDKLAEVAAEMFDSRNFFLKEVLLHLEVTFLLNTAMARLHGFTNSLMKVPSSVVGQSREFERALATLLVIAAPFCPSFCSHLWRRVSTVASPSPEFNWERDVLEQVWPQVDMTYTLPLIIKTNGQDLCSIKLPRSELDALTVDEAMKLATPLEDYKKFWAWKTLQTKHLHVDPSVRAVLTLTLTKPNEKHNVMAVDKDGRDIVKND